MAGWAWHIVQLFPLNVGPNPPLSSPSMSPDTDCTSWKRRNAWLKKACSCIQGGESTAGPRQVATRPEIVLSLKRSSTQDRRQNETQDYSEQLRLLHPHLPAKQDTVRRKAD